MWFEYSWEEQQLEPLDALLTELVTHIDLPRETWFSAVVVRCREGIFADAKLLKEYRRSIRNLS